MQNYKMYSKNYYFILYFIGKRMKFSANNNLIFTLFKQQNNLSSLKRLGIYNLITSFSCYKLDFKK